MVHLFCYYYFNEDAVGYFTHLVHTKSIDIGHCTSIIEFLEDGFSTNFADPDIGGSIFIKGARVFRLPYGICQQQPQENGGRKDEVFEFSPTKSTRGNGLQFTHSSSVLQTFWTNNFIAFNLHCQGLYIPSMYIHSKSYSITKQGISKTKTQSWGETYG